MKQSGEELVVVGAGEFAEIAYEYFTHDSAYEVKAFSVERTYVTRTHFITSENRVLDADKGTL